MKQPASDDDFHASLRGEDPLGAVVRSHIHLEARVNRLLDSLTPFPDHLPRGLRYEQKVRLAVALGLDEDFLAPLKTLGDVRNEFAHGLNVKLTDEMVQRLWAAFSPADQQIVRDAYGNTQKRLKDAGMPEFDKADARHRFIAMSVTLDKILIVSEKETHEHRVAQQTHAASRDT